jgi:hypothetical protein
MFPEGAGIVSGNMLFAGKAFFNAKEAQGRAIAMGAAMFGASDIAVVFVDGREVRAAAFGASDEGFRSFAVRDGVSQPEAAAALDESRAVFESPDGGFTTKEVGGGTAH